MGLLRLRALAQPSVNMGDRDYNLTAEQRATKAKYPPVNKKLHSWGGTLEEAFEQVAMSMFDYMTDIETVHPTDTLEVKAEGDDMMSLLFHFLNEWLYRFSADMYFIPREVKVVSLDRINYKIRSIGWGEEFDLAKHPQGTEVKAITYSAMQIHETETAEIFVIIDI
uniref:Protein archease n=2 Tax=Callorhinchus milii TaxID=7868 RepID=A0A4W3J0I9_CALMI